jgi:hypothetical protein
MDPVVRSFVLAYSTSRLRSLIAMVARRALHTVNGSASHAIVRPVIVMAARTLGPGPTRLRLVKLAHNLSHGATVVELSKADRDGDLGPAQPTQRAA